jgi:hypothetical protein
MAWFRKDNKQDKKEETKPSSENPQDLTEMETANKKISKNVYTVYLKEKIGGTVATFAVLNKVKRWFDDETEIPYLRANGFLEVFPDVESDYANLDKGRIEKEINDLKSTLKKIKEEKDVSKVMKEYGNPKNLEFNLLKAEAQFRALKYKGRAYMTFGMSGEKEFTFIREGSHYIPQAIDNETFMAFYPSDSKKKTFGFTHRNKKEKYGMKALMSAAQAGAWIFGLVFLFGTAYLFWQSMDKWDAAEINIVKAECLAVGKDVVNLVTKQAQTISEITETLKEQLKPQSVIEGVAPK